MFQAKVVGQVVASRKDAGLLGTRLLLVQPVDSNGRARGRRQVAVDGVSSRDQDIVICVRAREASFVFPGRAVPTDLAIIGCVDEGSG